ncbi:MAG: universal stress protein [Terracidiphilus sp.]|jgi:nucleotide-binding universal stress UspA family protein
MGSRVFIGFQTILVAYDSSPQSEHALNIAFSLATTTHSKLVVFAVVRPPEPALRAELNATLDAAHEHYEQSFASIRERAKKEALRAI